MAMDTIRLNSLSGNVFRASAAEVNGSQERANIINVGRMLMAERAGRDQNILRSAESRTADFRSLMDGKGVTYEEANEKFQRNLLLYCAKITSNSTGEEAPVDMDSFRRNQRKYFSDRTFLRVLAGVVTDIITPVLPAVVSGAQDWLANTVYVGLGETYEVDVQSNDIFMFQDDSWGASRSKPSNYLYSYPITLNPTLKTAKATWKWYQLAGNNVDLGHTFNAISAGLYSKVTAMWYAALTTATSSTFFVPSGMTFTYSNANWISAAKKVAMANNTGIRNVIAFGDLLAVSHVLPSTANGSNTNLDAALATMLGIDWARYGYLGDFMGVRLFPVDNALVPGTQNTTMTEVIANNKIWVTAAPGAGYKPVYVAFEEGTPITIQLDPSETADMTIDVIASVSMDAKPVVASKMAVITPV